LANLYSLYQSRGGDLSPSQFVNLIQSSGGALASLGSLAGGTIAPLTSGAATGLAGAGGSAVGAGLSTAGQALGGIGTTLGIGMNLASLARALETGDDRALGAPVGSLAGLGIGAGVGTLIAPGVGTLIGAGLGAAAGGAIGSVIGQNLPHYYAVRGHSMRLGNEAADQYTTNVINAGYTGDITDVQQALGAGYANGRVRVDLNLPKDVAAAIGVPTNARIADMSSDQFALLLKAYSERAGANSNWFQGSGDVPYLDTKTRGEGDENYSGPTGPGAARAIADHVATTARGTFDILAQALAPQLAQLPPVAPLHWEDVNGTRIAPEIEYTQYNPHPGEPGAGPPTWDPASYDTIKQAAQAGTLSDLFMGGGAGLGTPSQREAAAAQGREYYDRMLHPWLYDPNYFNGSGSGGDSGGGPGAP